MQLLIPLVFFLILCVAMIVLAAKFKAPSATETVEALCDAILRGDSRTQGDLTSFSQMPEQVLETLKQIKDEHTEQAASYKSKILKKWDSENATFEQIQVPCGKEKGLIFDVRATLNQWMIISIKLKSVDSEAK